MSEMDFMGGMGGGAPAPGPPPTVAPLNSENDTGVLALQALEAWAQEENDPEISAGLADLIAKATKILAMDQKAADTALGVGPGEKFVRRSRGTSHIPGGGSY